MTSEVGIGIAFGCGLFGFAMVLCSQQVATAIIGGCKLIAQAIDRQTEFWKSEGSWPTRKEGEE